MTTKAAYFAEFESHLELGEKMLKYSQIRIELETALEWIVSGATPEEQVKRLASYVGICGIVAVRESQSEIKNPLLTFYLGCGIVAVRESQSEIKNPLLTFYLGLKDA